MMTTHHGRKTEQKKMEHVEQKNSEPHRDAHCQSWRKHENMSGEEMTHHHHHVHVHCS